MGRVQPESTAFTSISNCLEICQQEEHVLFPNLEKIQEGAQRMIEGIEIQV
jgi:hypothetical protein